MGSTVKIDDVAGTDVELIQNTDYPWNGKVSITVNPAKPAEMSIRVRAPRHDVSALYRSTPSADGLLAIAVNGTALDPPVANGYAVITRTWQAGDKIDLEVPLQVQRVKGIDKIAATKGRVALRFGPLMYSLESVDQKLDNVLRPDADLQAAVARQICWTASWSSRGRWADGTSAAGHSQLRPPQPLRGKQQIRVRLQGNRGRESK